MKRIALGLALLPALLGGPATAPAGEVEVHEGFFPYPVHRTVLENGLHVLAIPTPEFKDVLSYNTLVLAGARNEVEPGKTGLAHLFEHILFRHMHNGEVNGYDEAVGRLGAHNNAWTWFDITYYHPTTFASNLRPLAELEAERFMELDFTEKIFRTEAGAVLGEYRNSSANPGRRMGEVRLGLMYGDHGYGHTAIGTLEDVEDMPNEYEAALRFYDDYYRPNNCVLLVSGDVQPAGVFDLATELYGSWEPGDAPEMPPVPAIGGPLREHVPWNVDVPPRVELDYRMPAFDASSVATAVGELLPELLTSETAPLYRELRGERQLVSSLSLGSAVYNSFDEGPFVLSATIFKDKWDDKGEAVFDEVLDAMVEATDDLRQFSQREGAAELLDALKSKWRYDLLAQVSSPADAASTYSWYYRFGRELDVLDQLVASIDGLTPADVDRVAAQVFVPENRVIVTLSHDPAQAGGEDAR